MFLRFASILSGMLILHSTAAVAAIYFAAEQPPPPNSAPAEAPLCYKFQDTVSLEEQLGKLKVKYGTAIYDEKIVKKEDGSRSLVAKKKEEETGLTVEYFYSDNPTACNEYKKQNTLDECFVLKSVFGTCNDGCKSSTWTSDIESEGEGRPVLSEMIGSKEFFQQGIRKKIVLFIKNLSCGNAICTDMVSAAIFSKKDKVWKIDIFNKELGEFSYFPWGEFHSAPGKFNRLGKDGIAVIVEDIYPSIDRSLPNMHQVYNYEVHATIIGYTNNEPYKPLYVVTAEDYFYPGRGVPYKWTSDIKCADEDDRRYDIAIHSYGINGTGKYFDRIRGYTMSGGELKEAWRDDDKEVDKKDKDIGTLCQAVDAIDETTNSYYLKNTCSLFKQREVDGNFPLKSEILENACFIHHKQFSQESINKLCSSYDYNAAVKRYSLLENSELRNKLKINIIPADILSMSSEETGSIYIENVLPAYFGNHKKQALTEGGCLDLGELKEEDKENMRQAEGSEYGNIDIFSFIDKRKHCIMVKISILNHHFT